jgi:two-component system chemotaxis response regulator CheB
VTKILVVDDSALMRRVLGSILAGEPDMEVAYARDGHEAIVMLHRYQPDVVTLDVQMPGIDGLACLDRIMLERPSRVLMVSSLTEAGSKVALDALERGAVDFIAKPVGTISLGIDVFKPAFLEKVRNCAAAKIRYSKGLTERVRLLAKAVPAPPPRPAEPAPVATKVPRGGIEGRAVVLVGTSTGGPPALDALLSPLPPSFPWPIVVAQHMPAAFTGPLARRLGALCSLDVAEVLQPVPLVPGRVYVGRGDADIVVGERGGEIIVQPVAASEEHRWHPSVDRLVTSALQHLAAASLIGVLMTGMGNDGAAAMTRLRNQGGRTIAESEETAVVWGMPGELVRAGGADVVLRLPAIAGQLMDWARV